MSLGINPVIVDNGIATVTYKSKVNKCFSIQPCISTRGTARLLTIYHRIVSNVANQGMALVIDL